MNAKVFTPVTGASSPELQVMSQVGPPEEDIFEEAVLSEIYSGIVYGCTGRRPFENTSFEEC
jgi:hypothetical protein